MTTFDIGHYRLFNQGIIDPPFEEVGQVVAHLGALQAQDYASSLWAIGLRLKEGTLALVEQAIANRSIVRTWPMRGTLHFIAAEDVRWMLKLLTPRVISSTAARQRELEIDDQILGRSKELFIKALEGGQQLTRPEMYEVLAKGDILPTGQRGIHIISRLSQEGLLCFGSYRDRQPAFALLDEWLPPTRAWEREESLAKLAQVYFTGHGPATLPDFERWAGLKTSDARVGLEMVKAHLRLEKIEGQTYWLSQNEPVLTDETDQIYLLPGFDEYILGYKDRTAVLAPQHFQKIVPGGNGIFLSTIISGGQVVGTWKRATRKAKISLTPVPFSDLSQAEISGLEVAAQHYSRFMQMPVELSLE